MEGTWQWMLRTHAANPSVRESLRSNVFWQLFRQVRTVWFIACNCFQEFLVHVHARRLSSSSVLSGVLWRKLLRKQHGCNYIPTNFTNSLSTDATVSQGGMIQITNYNTPECTGTASTSQTPSGQCTDASWGSSMYVCSDDGTGYGKTVTRIQYQCQKCACAAQFTSQSVSGSCHSFWEGGHTVATCLASDVIALV